MKSLIILSDLLTEIEANLLSKKDRESLFQCFSNINACMNLPGLRVCVGVLLKHRFQFRRLGGGGAAVLYGKQWSFIRQNPICAMRSINTFLISATMGLMEAK